MQAASIAALGYHSCAVDLEGALTCWGENSNYQLGDYEATGDTVVTVDFEQTQTTLPVGGTGSHTCVIADGKVVCWGRNTNGQCGTDTLGNALETPTEVVGL